ncbi:MAG: DUF4878 domain-containing protein [Acidobacteriota bacterium]|nr:DUF4878 domain-containing protein [Acidobacteriota bacterium]
MRASISNSKFFLKVILTGLLVCLAATPVVSQQPPPRSPSDTVREFYKTLRERKFREAFSLSIYKPAIEPLKAQEFEDLRPDFEKMALAVNERIPEKVEIMGEQISGDLATVFVKVLDSDGKETMEPAGLIMIDGAWVLGDRENLEIVKKAGKKFFFNARIDAHHADVQDMLTRISLALLLYNQQHNGQFANLATLIAAGLLPKDLEGTESTGYRFHINVSPDAKTWNAQAEPAQYGRSGRLSFFMDATGVRSGDTDGKPLSPRKN